MRIRPVGHRVLIEPDKIEETTEGGIIIPTKAVQDESKKQQIGTVLDIGNTCWKDNGGSEKATVSDNRTFYEKTGEPWCKVGDKIIFPSYAGMKIPDNEGGYRDDLLLLNDQDITAVIEED